MPLGNAHEQQQDQDHPAGRGPLTQQTTTSVWPSQAQSIATQGGGAQSWRIWPRATNCRLATRSFSAYAWPTTNDKAELTIDAECMTYMQVHKYTGPKCPLIGYLLTCLRTGAWRGSVQVPGSSLSIRLPALVAWLSFGLRGPGAVGRERLKGGVLSSK